MNVSLSRRDFAKGIGGIVLAFTLDPDVRVERIDASTVMLRRDGSDDAIELIASLPVTIDEPLALRFVPETEVTEEELELEESMLDEIPYSGNAFDLGEAVAQSLALAIDPYAVGPNAEQARKDAGLLDEAAAGPFAALAALKKS